MGVFGAFQVGLNFIKPGNRKGTAGGETWGMKFDISSSFGFSVGGGFIFYERFNVGFRYFGLGEPELDSTITDLDGNEWIQSIDQEVGVLAITLGVNF